MSKTVDMSKIVVQQIVSPWLNAPQAAEYLGICVGTLRNWTSARFVPFSKRGGIVRYHWKHLDDW